MGGRKEREGAEVSRDLASASPPSDPMTDPFQVPIINSIRQMHASAQTEYERIRERTVFILASERSYKKKGYAYLRSYARQNTLKRARGQCLNIRSPRAFRNHFLLRRQTRFPFCRRVITILEVLDS